MQWWVILIYIAIFAFLGSVLYIWGVVKHKNIQRDLFLALHVKGEKVIIRALKSNGEMSKKELDEELRNLSASLFYSKVSIHVQDPSSFCQDLLERLCAAKKVLTKTRDGNVVYLINEKHIQDQ